MKQHVEMSSSLQIIQLSQPKVWAFPKQHKPSFLCFNIGSMGRKTNSTEFAFTYRNIYFIPPESANKSECLSTQKSVYLWGFRGVLEGDVPKRTVHVCQKNIHGKYLYLNNENIHALVIVELGTKTNVLENVCIENLLYINDVWMGWSIYESLCRKFSAQHRIGREWKSCVCGGGGEEFSENEIFLTPCQFCVEILSKDLWVLCHLLWRDWPFVRGVS